MIEATQNFLAPKDLKSCLNEIDRHSIWKAVRIGGSGTLSTSTTPSANSDGFSLSGYKSECCYEANQISGARSGREIVGRIA